MQRWYNFKNCSHKSEKNRKNMHKSNINSIFPEKTSLIENVEVTFIGKTRLSDPTRREKY